MELTPMNSPNLLTSFDGFSWGIAPYNIRYCGLPRYPKFFDPLGIRILEERRIGCAQFGPVAKCTPEASPRTERFLVCSHFALTPETRHLHTRRQQNKMKCKFALRTHLVTMHVGSDGTHVHQVGTVKPCSTCTCSIESAMIIQIGQVINLRTSRYTVDRRER